MSARFLSMRNKVCISPAAKKHNEVREEPRHQRIVNNKDMRPKVIQFVTLIILTTTLCLVEVQGQELTVSDTQNSGCLSRAPGYDSVKEPNLTIILEKEGDVLTVQLLNYQSNCATYDLQGRRFFGEPNRGIYISNGRKRVVK